MLFNYKELAEKSSDDTEDKLSEIFISKYLTTQFLKVSSLENDLMRLPSENEFFFLQSDTAFNALTFIVIISRIFNIKHLHISTYSISKDSIEALIYLHDMGKIETLTLLIPESKFKRNQLAMSYLMEKAKSRSNIKLLYANVQAKVCLVETHENHYVIEGSGNLNENSNFEQYIFAFSKGLFDFRMQLFTNPKLKKC